MTDGTGTIDYTYDELSRLTSETKYFYDLPNAPVTGNKYTISYAYNLSGNLKSITDPFGIAVSYTHDKTGRLTKVDGTPLSENPTGRYADNIKYRAFGGIKQMDYKLPDYTSQIKMEYDNRLRVNYFETTKSGGYLMKADFSYNADGRVEAKDDLLDNKFDRTNKYDFAGRLNFNQFGMGQNNQQQSVRIYEQTITYDAFSMMISRTGEHWGNPTGFSQSYVNGRIQNQTGLTYDAAGNIAHSGSIISPHDFQATDFDAAGRRVKFFSSSKGRQGSMLNMITEQQTEHEHDGDGRPVKEKFGYNFYHINDPQPTMTTNVKAYQVWSTVLGSSLTKIQPDGTKWETKVFAGGAVIAKQNDATDTVEWMTSDPVTGTEGKFRYTSSGGDAVIEEHEPLGQEVLPLDPADLPDPPPNEIAGDWNDRQWQCQVPERFYGGFWGMPMHCIMRVIQTSEYNRYIGKLEPWFESSTGNSYSGNSFAETLESNPTNISGWGTADERLRDEHPTFWDDYKDAAWKDWGDTYANLPARRLTSFETGILKDTIKKYLTENCKKYIAKLINQVAKDVGGTVASTDVLELFDAHETSRGVTEGPDQSGIWGYLSKSPGATNTTYWENNNISIALPISDKMYGKIGVDANGNKYVIRQLTSSEVSQMSFPELVFRNFSSALTYVRSEGGAFQTMHELIHNSVKPIGAGDVELAQAALSLTGNKLDVDAIKADGEKAYKIASAIWSNRLREGCGKKGVHKSYKKYIR